MTGARLSPIGHSVAASAALAMALLPLCVGELLGQSGGRDLPPGFRTVAGVTLNRDSALTIRAKLGVTRERRSAVEHEAYTIWCYVPADGPPASLLELMSDAGDMGTPGRELDVIRLRADAPRADREGCATLSSGAALATPAGLRLGLTATQIQDLLGPPARRAADSLVYEYDAREFLSPDGPAYEIWNTLESRETCFDAGPPFANVEARVVAVLRNGRAAEIRLERNDQSVC